jgi:hypothetical protein
LSRRPVEGDHGGIGVVDGGAGELAQLMGDDIQGVALGAEPCAFQRHIDADDMHAALDVLHGFHAAQQLIERGGDGGGSLVHLGARRLIFAHEAAGAAHLLDKAARPSG